MATGDQSDILNRLQRLMPPGWFAPGQTPIRDALLTGIANALAFVFSLFTYLKLQTRIATATDGFLDLIAFDYFGNSLRRLPNQSDASYQSRIQSSLLPLRNTRQAIINAVALVTGRPPIVFEPRRPLDTGVYNGPGLAYSAVGGYGSLAYPYQSFVTAFRPAGTGIPNVAGYGISTGAYNTGSQAEYATAEFTSGVNDDDIYAAINSVRLGGTIVWTRIISSLAELNAGNVIDNGIPALVGAASDVSVAFGNLTGGRAQLSGAATDTTTATADLIAGRFPLIAGYGVPQGAYNTPSRAAYGPL
jgi:hypothetical protein